MERVQHTPDRLKVMKEPENMPGLITYHEQGEANEWCMISSDNGRWLISFRLNGELLTDMQAAIARRLAVCWNACQGISTEALESGVIQEMRAALDFLQGMFCGQEHELSEYERRELKNARAVLSKLEG
jgi:hypothetical protein